MNNETDLVTRIELLERQIRWRNYFGVGILGVCALTAASFTVSAQDSRNLRVRSIVIEDDQGRDRIVIGAPVPDPKEGKRLSPSVGMVINDPSGYERFGLGLTQDGRMGMGFDAPPKTGDDRNRERINVVADEKGGSYIRFLDRRTRAAGRLRLDPENRFWLEFIEMTDKEWVTRRVGFSGEETVREPR